MKRKAVSYCILTGFILLSLAFKLILIFKYKNELTLSSDDLNYVKSAVVLIRRGIFTFHNYNEPTVFVTPFYPFFLAVVFKLFGYGIAGMQAVRVIQALVSCVTIVAVFLTADMLFNRKVALATAFLTAFYIPNIITVGYILTETLFTALLCVLVYCSIKFSCSPSFLKFAGLGLIWAAATMCRPTIALYPALLFPYLFFYRKYSLPDMIKRGSAMLITFVMVLSPWWVRNYMEYNQFIPLSAASGNPMLQGTYVDYRQTPENVVYYKLGKNALETNKTEVEVAKRRIKQEFGKDFWGYLRWFTIGKTWLLWGTVFYWKQFFGINPQVVLHFHYFLLTGFIGIGIALFKDFSKNLLPVLILLYFNIIHCVYMAFDRYAFPVMPLLSIFCAFLAVKLTESILY